MRANKRPEAGELRRENLTRSVHSWQLLVIWSGSGQNILVLLLYIFIKMIFPFQHLHMPVCSSENSIHWLSIHMVCIQWHHLPLHLPSWTSPIDHQNTVSQSLWGLKGLSISSFSPSHISVGYQLATIYGICSGVWNFINYKISQVSYNLMHLFIKMDSNNYHLRNIILNNINV